MTFKELKKEFKNKYSRYFDHKEFGYDDLMIEEDLEKIYKEGKKERDSKSKFVEVVVEEQRACSECLLKLGDIVPECFTCAGTGKEKYFIKIGTKKLKSKQP